MTDNETKLIRIAIDYATEGPASITQLREAAEDVLAERGRGPEFELAVAAVAVSTRAARYATRKVEGITTQAARNRVYQMAAQRIAEEDALNDG